MNEDGKSDGRVLPAKRPNNAGRPAAEAVEGRRPAEGNTDSTTRSGRSAGPGVPIGLDRVREAARRDKDARFTALLHHVTLERLHAAYRAIRPQAAAGTDGVTWASYEQDLEASLKVLHARVHSGAYRARPSRRVYIPKADGRLRPLGIATDDSYCPSCRCVSGCSGMVLVCAGQGIIYGFAGVIMSGSADSCGGGLVPLGPVPWPGAAGGRVQVAGSGDASAAGGLDVAGPRDAQPAAGAAPGVELGGFDPVVDDAGAAAQPAGGFGHGDLAAGVGGGGGDVVGVADPLDGLDVEGAAVAGGQPVGVEPAD